MKYGNRSMNQPVIDLRTQRCYITPQNHGYAVDEKSLTNEWKPLFVNANDHSNEGIILSCGPEVSTPLGLELEGKKVLFNLHKHQRWGEYYIVDYENVYMVIE